MGAGAECRCRIDEEWPSIRSYVIPMRAVMHMEAADALRHEAALVAYQY